MRNGRKIKNQLEPGLVDTGAGTKAVLASVQVATEKKRLFRYECKQIIIKILIKQAERCPFQFSLVRDASSLDPQKMVQSSSTASLRFKKLVNNFCTLNKISSEIADNAKFEYDSFQSVAIKKHGEVFLTYDPRTERLDVFLGKYVRLEFENCWHICKAVFVFLHGQSFVERGILVNKLTIDDKMQEKSIVLQRLIYDGLKQQECPVSELTISWDLRKSCLLASQRYKSDLEKINSDKKNADISLKRSAKLQEIEVVKSQKAKLQESVDFLRKRVEAGMINADKNQGFPALFCSNGVLAGCQKKRKRLCELEQPLGHLEREYKRLQMYVYLQHCDITV